MKRTVLAMIAIAIASRTWAVDYADDVYPILEKYCVGCHTQDDPQGGLVMEDFESFMTGGDSGLALTPGVASSSRMFLMASGKLEPTMPPDDAQGPNESELETIARWIDEGAKGPDGDVPLKRPLRTPKIETAKDVLLPITAIASSQDGVHTAIARFDSIDLIDASGKKLTAITGELGKVNSLQFSGDGTRLLVAAGQTGAYGVAAIYDVVTGKLIREFLGHRDVLYAAVFSPDESRIATAGYDSLISIWDVSSGKTTATLPGHNGAIYDLAFSPDGKHLVSACADETAKVWDVFSGARLDTLGQSEGEVNAVSFSPDGRFIVAASEDNRLRVWRFVSQSEPRTNPIVATRYLDESALTNFAFTPDGKGVVVLSEAGNVKLLRSSDWSTVAAMEPVDDQASDLLITHDGTKVRLSLMNGQVVDRLLPEIRRADPSVQTQKTVPIYLDLGSLSALKETDLDASQGFAEVGRGVEIEGALVQANEKDSYRFQARRGEMWAIDVDAIEGRLDPRVEVLDANGQPVTRTRLQAVRDTYFTFKGKDSSESNDFRLFNWQEIGLGQYLYASGEVTRTWMHPRGPDSGFIMYPGFGNRETFFGTTHTTHALSEPAYVVRELDENELPAANGLPVFEIAWESDDDPSRIDGASSRLVFQSPQDASYIVRVSDTRGQGGQSYKYRAKIRAASPAFEAKLGVVNQAILPGVGREIACLIEPTDEFIGEVTFEISELPEGWHSSFPVTVEPGQRSAVGTIWVDADVKEGATLKQITVTARATHNGRSLERSAGMIQDLKVGPPPSVVPSLHPIDRDAEEGENWTLEIERGQTVSARVKLQRKKGFKNEVSFGKEFSGRNTAHGVYVDNIGLNGLLVLADQTEREFFITADPIAKLGKRTFFLEAEVDGKVTSRPITICVKDPIENDLTGL
jgi:WD40 repeat protein